MTGLSGTEMFVLVGAGLLLFHGKQVAEAVQEAISNFRGGGPKPPTHPLPANDSTLLTRRRIRRKTSES